MTYEDWEYPETWLVMYDISGGMHQLMPEDERPLRDAVRRYADAGRDELLSLTLIEGTDLSILVSRVVSWWVRTEEHVRRSTAFFADGQRKKAIRDAELGVQPD
jgi:hypothetical protein